MARSKRAAPGQTRKKTCQGNGRYSAFPQKGSACATGGRSAKKYRKRYRGQGKK